MLHPTKLHRELTLDALREVVAERDESIETTKIARIHLPEMNRQVVTLNDDPTPQPLSVISKYLKAPAPFLASVDRTLAQQIVDYQNNQMKQDHIVVLRNGVAVGHQKKGTVRLSGSQIVDKLIENVGDFRNASFYDLGNYVDISVVGGKVTLKKPKKVNDISEGGIRCLYSEVMARNPSIEPYVERLVCTNGMICKDRLSVFKFDTLDEFLAQFETSVKTSLEYVDTAIRAQLKKAAETEVERSEQAIRQIFTSNNINTRLLPGAIAALVEEEDGTAFGVLQAITRAANNAGYAHRTLLQGVTAKELSRLEVAHCPTCWASMAH